MCYFRPFIHKTLYKFLLGRIPFITYFKIFGCKCFALNTCDHLGKFDEKFNEDIFLEYSSNKKACWVYNRRTMVLKESIHIVFDESNIYSSSKDCGDDINTSSERKQDTFSSQKNEENAKKGFSRGKVDKTLFFFLSK